jgi:pilus assembly protein CpaD
MKMMRLLPIAVTLGAVLATAPAEAKQNFGVNSANQPVVSPDGAVVPNCPKFKAMELDPGATTDPNYGCAINSNLAAMVADPMDLIHGKSDNRTDTNSATRAIKAWNEFEPTSKLWTTTTKVDVKGAGGQ